MFMFSSLTGGGEKMVHSLSTTIELHHEPGKDHTHMPLPNTPQMNTQNTTWAAAE